MTEEMLKIPLIYHTVFRLSGLTNFILHLGDFIVAERLYKVLQIATEHGSFLVPHKVAVVAAF